MKAKHAMALQSAGTLSALIFLISSIFEVVTINNLYASQRFLISLLLIVLALWAFIEVALINRQLRSQALRNLTILLGLQIGLLAARHGLALMIQPEQVPSLATPIAAPDFGLAILFLPLNLLMFLAISRCLIHAFAAAERQRANQLQQQMIVLEQTRDQLRDSQAQQRLLQEQQRTQLEQKLKTSLTAAAVVHEIQQPLSTILLNCRTATDRLRDQPSGSLPKALLNNLHQLTRDGDQVVSSMERMRMLLRNVESEHTPFDLCTSIETSVLFLKQDLATHQVRPQLEGFATPCHLEGDAAQLQIAVVNLIRNALQAMQAQPPASRQLLVQLQRCSDRLMLQVADSGPGFPEGYCNNTSWELLKSTKATGMGIGLFLAETAATNHHGQLRIGRSSRLGGAEITIELPLTQSAPATGGGKGPCN